MKKLFIFIFMLFVVNVNFGQTIRSAVSETSINPFDCEYVRVFENNELKYHYLSITYQNAKYQHIVDIGSLFFTDSTSVVEFISDLDKFLPYAGTSTEIEIKRTQYTLMNMKSGTSALFDNENNYAFLKPAKITKLIIWLKSLDLSLLN